MSSELIGELGQVGLTIGQGPVSNNSSTTVSNSNDENSPERKRQNVNVRPYNQSSRPVNRKRFRTAWLMFDIFKDWLRPHPSPELANCIVCNRVIKAGKSELEKHAAGKRHLTMLKEMNSSGNTGAADTRYARGEVVVLHEEMVGVQEFDSAYDGLQVMGMGLDGGLVQSEVVVMGEEMVVSSGTVVYQEEVPHVITYNGNVLMSGETSESHRNQSAVISHSAEYTTSTPTHIDQTLVNSSEVIVPQNITENLNSDQATLEELNCPDINVVTLEELKHEGTSVNQIIENHNDINDEIPAKSYAETPDPGTATRRGGPGPTKRHSQRYRKAWEQLPETKDWLTSHHNIYRAVCKICNKVLLADITVIKAHATSRKHALQAAKCFKSKRRLKLTYDYQGEAYMDEDNTRLSIIAESGGAVSVSSGGESSYKEDYDRKFGDSNKGTTGAAGGTGGAQSVDNSEGNYTTGIYTPQQRNVGPPVQMVTKAVVMNPAPNWKATAIVNGHVTRLDLSDYVGRYLVLVFYPQDFSKICASEINALSDRSYEFRSIQTEIVACSVDSHLAHLTWSKISRADGGVNLPKIPLIADPTHTIAKAYGVLLPDKGHTLRAHFIIDKRGILRHMSVTDTLVGRGTDELFRLVKALQYVDEVEEPVPADWNQQNE